MTAFVLIVVVGPALVWRIVAVRRDPSRPEAWAITVAVAGLAVALALNLPREFPALAGGASPKLLQLGQNVAVIGAFAALQLFYLSFVARFLRRPRIRAELVVVVAVVVALAVLAALVVDDDGLRFEAAALRDPAVTLFYAVGGAYITYALVTQLWWTLRFGRRLTDPVLRVAALVAAAGAAALIVAEVVRTAAAVEAGVGAGRWAVATARPVLSLIAVGTGLLVAGLVLPVLLGGIDRLRRRVAGLVTHRQLRPLWTAVRWAYPEIVRPPEPVDRPPERPATPWWERRGARSTVGVAAQLRLQQCRDGYLRAAPLLDGAATETLDPRVDRFVTELRACPRIEIGSPDVGSALERRRLRRVSRALRDRGLDWCRPDLDGTSATAPEHR